MNKNETRIYRGTEMINTVITRQNTFNQLTDNDNESRHRLELLRFFVTHPDTRFNRLAVLQSQDESEYEIERALAHLITEGIVKVAIENNARFYSLTEDESRRKSGIEMVKQEWRHWQLGFKKTAPRGEGFLKGF
jgi:hypothetical protein